MKWNFEGKVAFITGGASGIGRKIALDMASNGASVAIFDLNKELGIQTLAEVKEAGNGNAEFFSGSVSNKETVEEAVDKTYEKLGEIDFLINCAGILRDFLISRFEEDKWDSTINVNLKGVAICTQAVATKWVNKSRAKAKEQGEKYIPTLENPAKVIVNIASMAADGNVGQVA